MHIIFSIIGILVTILFVVGTHEAAHFFVAKLLNVKVLRFSIGFGKPLISWHDKSGTEYVIAPIPLGGYVRMLDETEGSVTPEEMPFAYNRQPFYKKFLIVLAGPACNLVCAFLLYWLILMIGFTTIKPIIGSISPRSIAAEAGLQSNYVITQVDGKETNTWPGILFRLLSQMGSTNHLAMQIAKLDGSAKKEVLLDLTNWRLDELNPDPLTSLGITPFEPKIPLVIGKIAADSPAEKTGLKIGDTIIALNQKAIQNWQEVFEFIYKHPNTQINFTVLRNKKNLTIPVNIGQQQTWLKQTHGWLGIAPTITWPKEVLSKIQYSPLLAIPHAYTQVQDLTYLNLVLFGKMLTGKLSLKSIGGPITIFDSAGDALNNGMLAFLSFLAFLSIAIGVINLLPIPGLDGGHLFLQTIELILGRPIPDSILIFAFRLGFIFLFLILIQALINDILRLY